MWRWKLTSRRTIIGRLCLFIVESLWHQAATMLFHDVSSRIRCWGSRDKWAANPDLSEARPVFNVSGRATLRLCNMFGGSDTMWSHRSTLSADGTLILFPRCSDCTEPDRCEVLSKICRVNHHIVAASVLARMILARCTMSKCQVSSHNEMARVAYARCRPTLVDAKHYCSQIVKPVLMNELNCANDLS